MTSTLDDYNKLKDYSTETKVLQSLNNLLMWDQETYMPPGAIEFRSKQSSSLSSMIYERSTSLEFKNLLSKLIDLDSGKMTDSAELDDAQRRSLELFREDLIKDEKLSKSFIEKFSSVTSKTVPVWQKAKESNDFSLFAPHLEKIIEICQEKSKLLGDFDHPYDPLLDIYEPGMTVKDLDKLFADLKPKLIKLTKKLSTKDIDTEFLFGSFNKTSLMEINALLLKTMGLREGDYRLDLSAHPFCMPVHRNDLRLTTHTNSSDLVSGNFAATIHEGGHALYELNLPEEHFGTPICEALSTGIHESQSKFWESFLGQSLEFWEFVYKDLQERFEQLKEVPLENFYQAINKISPSFIRIFADEVTYGLHVILRYEMEKALIEGSIKAKDIPNVWNEKMKESLGIIPKNFQEGCLQDIHWAWGLFGYFPSYLLGNLYAAQLYEVFCKEHPDYKVKLSQGNWTFARDWLIDNVHSYGRLLTQKQLMEKVTGSPLTSKAFEKYLDDKYQ